MRLPAWLPVCQVTPAVERTTLLLSESSERAREEQEGERESDGEREKEQSHTADRLASGGGVDVREIIRHINAPATQLQAARAQGGRQKYGSSDVDILRPALFVW